MIDPNWKPLIEKLRSTLPVAMAPMRVTVSDIGTIRLEAADGPIWHLVIATYMNSPEQIIGWLRDLIRCRPGGDQSLIPNEMAGS